MGEPVAQQLNDLTAKINTMQSQIENLTASVEAKTSSAKSMAKENKSKNISGYLLSIGFGVAMVIAISCLIMSGLYLFRYLDSTNSGIDTLIKSTNTASDLSILSVSIAGRLQMARFALLSCGAFAGLSFGFLGFALFLIGIKEEMDVEAQSESYHIKFARMSPGTLVILTAAVLIGVCITRQLSFGTEYRSIQDADNEPANARQSNTNNNASTQLNNNSESNTETKNSSNNSNSGKTGGKKTTYFNTKRG
jgi:tetrahydromethanopterin S-methyltransferase subunit B